MLKTTFSLQTSPKHSEEETACDSFLIADTTDVQLVSAVELRDVSAFRVRCDLMAGSIAQGCMVVLIGELDNITLSFAGGPDIEKVMNTTNPTSCYNRIVAYDIESDGTVGSLAVPGNILADVTSNSVAPCSQRQNAPLPSEFISDSFNINGVAKLNKYDLQGCRLWR